jgi:uncharacterized coiled-coil protein SlyX
MRYNAVNAMLLNEFLKEHKKVDELTSNAAKQDARISELTSTVANQRGTFAELNSAVARQQNRFAQQKAQIKALTCSLQRVSAEIEVSKFAPGRIRRSGPAARVAATNP